MEQKVPKQIQKKKLKVIIVNNTERLADIGIIELLLWTITDLQITLMTNQKRGRDRRTFKKYNWPIRCHKKIR